MGTSTKNSFFSALGGWFSKQPPSAVTVAVFGKSAIVNGHQDLAGDATKSLLEFARTVYYEGALPHCTRWEAELRDRERVLSSRVVRWCDGRMTVARFSAVAEGGATTQAFAPMVTCAEVDGAYGLADLPEIDAQLASVESQLLASQPTGWAAILAPVRTALLGRVASIKPKPADAVAAAVSAAHLARLGADSAAWTESLAEELNLAMTTLTAEQAQRAAAKQPALGSRTAEAPRTGVEVATELQGWSAFLRCAGPEHGEFWLMSGDGVGSVRIVVGRAKERDFAQLWRSRDAASVVPEPLPESTRERVRNRTGTWLVQAGGDKDAGPSQPS